MDNETVLAVPGYGPVMLRRLSSGYWHARGRGPCEWAQGESLASMEPYVESSAAFRSALNDVLAAKKPTR
jgi:hypothetical protein